MISDRDLRRAEAFGRLAARSGCGIKFCPYEADGNAEQRQLAARFVHAYVGAGGRVGCEEGEEGDMPKQGAPAGARWRRVRLPSGKTVRVAVVKRSAAGEEGSPDGEAQRTGSGATRTAAGRAGRAGRG